MQLMQSHMAIKRAQGRRGGGTGGGDFAPRSGGAATASVLENRRGTNAEGSYR